MLNNIFILLLITIIGLSLTFQLLQDRDLYLSNQEVEITSRDKATGSLVTEQSDHQQEKASTLLFGDYNQPPPVEVLEALPVSTVKLNLLAIYYSKDPTHAGVSIATESDTDLYKVGDELFAGIEITEINLDRVTLKRNGQLEILVFDNESSQNGITMTSIPLHNEPSEVNMADVSKAQGSLKGKLEKLRSRLNAD